jgi:hypothetical protein
MIRIHRLHSLNPAFLAGRIIPTINEKRTASCEKAPSQPVHRRDGRFDLWAKALPSNLEVIYVVQAI